MFCCLLINKLYAFKDAFMKFIVTRYSFTYLNTDLGIEVLVLPINFFSVTSKVKR